MLRKNLWNRNVPKLEYDQRAREARVRLERVERLLVKRHAVADFRPFRRLRVLGFGIYGNGRRGDRDTGSPSDRRSHDIGATAGKYLVFIPCG